MKTLVISDLHGENPLRFIERQRKEGVERLVCLGDYDAPELLEKLLDLDMEKEILLGNHDYGFLAGEDFWSPFLQDDPETYILDWAKPSKARSYALGAVSEGERRQLIVEERNGRKVAYVHGSLVDYKTERPLTWGRIIVDGNVRGGILKANFNAMERQGYDILFRGHDHIGVLFGIGKNSSELGQMFEDADKPLDSNRRYIVSVGSFENGEYVVFDDKEMKVQFGDQAWRS
jgi:predicted phosphodiesterase